jgi:DNA-directed RNA polymerase specialized sigma24 family protein
MPPEKRDLEQIFAQSFPHFLEMMKSDRAAGLAEFAKCARPWLLAHPTPSMRALTAAEQQDVAEDTVQRCLHKEGEPLRNYTDLWGNFGAWLSSVAENTCAAKYRKRGQAAPRPSPEPAAGKAPPATPSAPKSAKPKQPAAAQHRAVPKEERPSRAVHAFLGWLRSPRVFVPVLILAAVAIVRGIRPDMELIPSHQERSIPLIVTLLPESETKNVYYEVFPTPLLPPGGDEQTRPPVTTIFRQDRLVVFRLEREVSKEKSKPYSISIRNKAGESVWSIPLVPEFFEADVLFLRIDPTTFPPDDYEVHIVDAANAAVAGSTFRIR